jgi:hypothetical protein
LAFKERPVREAQAPAVGTEVLPGMPKYDSATLQVHVGKTEAFGDVPADVWEFRIGGYQICHKWLKDRKGRKLSRDDIEHYQKIVGAISETIRIMKKIDESIENHGGWPGAFTSKSAGEMA